VLDGLRGIAAFAVVLFHYLGPIHFPFIASSYIAVDLFFILSGFVIFHAYADKVRGAMRPSTFINKRISRLAPTYIVGTILGAMGTWSIWQHYGTEFDQVMFGWTALANLFFIPAFVNVETAEATGHLYPANRVLWSILYELIASIGFIWLLRLNRWGLAIGSMICFGLFTFGCYYWAAHTSAPLTGNLGWSLDHVWIALSRVFAGFMCGMLIYQMTRQPAIAAARPGSIFLTSGATIAYYTVAAIVLFFPFRFDGLYPFIAIGLFCPLLIAAGAMMTPRSGWLVKVSDWLGQLSFPVYCIHSPVHQLVESQLAWLRWSHQILLSIVLTIVLSVAILVLLDRISARKRISALLKPITG
jgi:peptidoglycan/LPS O-acetylase OafA/YrhL